VLLLAKLLLAPACVVAVSLAGRRWGVAVAGVLGGLPVVAGPILLVLTLVHGDSFGARSASGTLLGLLALSVFVVVYGRLCPFARPVVCLFAGWGAFLAAVAILNNFHPPALISLIVVAATFALGIKLLPSPEGQVGEIGPLPSWDLPARALAALALVLTITAASGSLGPGLSGLLAPFPIITSVLAVFTHLHGSPGQVRVLLRNFLVGFYGFASFCFVLAVGLDPLSTGVAFLAAISAALVVQLSVFALPISGAGAAAGR